MVALPRRPARRSLASAPRVTSLLVQRSNQETHPTVATPARCAGRGFPRSEGFRGRRRTRYAFGSAQTCGALFPAKALSTRRDKRGREGQDNYRPKGSACGREPGVLASSARWAFGPRVPRPRGGRRGVFSPPGTTLGHKGSGTAGFDLIPPFIRPLRRAWQAGRRRRMSERSRRRSEFGAAGLTRPPQGSRANSRVPFFGYFLGQARKYLGVRWRVSAGQYAGRRHVNTEAEPGPATTRQVAGARPPQTPDDERRLATAGQVASRSHCVNRMQNQGRGRAGQLERSTGGKKAESPIYIGGRAEGIAHPAPKGVEAVVGVFAWRLHAGNETTLEERLE